MGHETVLLASGDIEAYDALVEAVCRSCGTAIDPVMFRFTGRYGAGGRLHEVLIAVQGCEFRLRPGDRLLLDPAAHPDDWAVVAL